MYLKDINQTLISGLSSLQLFSMHGSIHHQREFRLFNQICEDNILCGRKKALLEELESLEYINEISVILPGDISDRKKESYHLLVFIKIKLHLQCCNNMISLELPPSCVQAMVHL